MAYPIVYLIGNGALLWRTAKAWTVSGVNIHGIYHTNNESLPSFIRPLNINIYQISKNNISMIGLINSSDCVLVSINNPFILPDLVIQRFSVVFNLHNGDVRKFRGIAEVCIFAALCINEREYGITLQLLEPGLEVDSGKVLAQKLFPISSADTFESLMHRSLKECEELLAESISIILNSNVGIDVKQFSQVVYRLQDVDWIARQASPNDLLRASSLGIFSSLLPGLFNRINSLNQLEHLLNFNHE